jgi:hypothetical protein
LKQWQQQIRTVCVVFSSGNAENCFFLSFLQNKIKRRKSKQIIQCQMLLAHASVIFAPKKKQIISFEFTSKQKKRMSP